MKEAAVMTKKRTKRRLLATTALIFLSLNAQVTDDSGRTFLTTIPLVPLPAGPAWRLARLLNRLLKVSAGLARGLAACWSAALSRSASARDRARLAGTMISIGLKSSLYGLGVDV